MLWILPPKNGSTSIKSVLGLRNWISREKALDLNRHLTVGVIRNPFERVVSALYSVYPGTDSFASRLRKFQLDSHVRPQAPAFAGFRIDHWIRFEHLLVDWGKLGLPCLPHLNRGGERPRHEFLEWGALRVTYQDDMELYKAHT